MKMHKNLYEQTIIEYMKINEIMLDLFNFV